MLDQKDEYIMMAEVESTHWWYRTLHEMVLETICNHFNHFQLQIVDAGCGTGGLIRFLTMNGFNRINGFDVSETAVGISREKQLNVSLGDLQSIRSFLQVNDADVIVANDVFYFFSKPEQKKIADSIHLLLQLNGLLIVNMPAMKMFRGMHDMKVGISNRFEREEIPLVFDSEKFHLVQCRYWPFLLSPLILFSRFFQRVQLKSGSKTPIRSDLRKENTIVNSICYYICKFENYLFKTKPFGSSLFLVFKKVA